MLNILSHLETDIPGEPRFDDSKISSHLTPMPYKKRMP